jgi:LEA14-like dessication related protein
MDVRLKIVLVAVTLVIFCVGLYLWFYAYSASKVEVRDVRFIEAGNISLEGVDVLGAVELYNGGLIPVSVEKIDYKMILEHNEMELARGVINGGVIPAGGSVNYTISTHVSWKPTADLASSLLSGEGTYAKIQGTVYLNKLWFIDVSLPFEYRMDLGGYVKQFIAQQIGSAVGTLIDAIKDVF